MTYTYAILEVSKVVYKEIAAKLKILGYEDRFHDQDGEVIDMHGIALRDETE